MQKSEKANDTTPRKLCYRQTDGRTDRAEKPSILKTIWIFPNIQGLARLTKPKFDDMGMPNDHVF